MTALKPAPAATVRAPRRAVRTGGWALIVLGVVHLATEVGTAGSHDAATRRAMDGLAQVRMTTPGPQPTLADLFLGFSLMMGLLLLTVGTLVVLMARYADRAPGLLTAALWVMVVASAIGLVLSWLLFPLPPLVGLSVSLVAGVTGLVTTRRTTAPA